MNALEREAIDAADNLHEAIKKVAQTWRKIRPLTKRINRGHQPEHHLGQTQLLHARGATTRLCAGNGTHLHVTHLPQAVQRARPGRRF